MKTVATFLVLLLAATAVQSFVVVPRATTSRTASPTCLQAKAPVIGGYVQNLVSSAQKWASEKAQKQEHARAEYAHTLQAASQKWETENKQNKQATRKKFRAQVESTAKKWACEKKIKRTPLDFVIFIR